MAASLSVGRVNVPTHQCVTTQELAQAIRQFQVALGVGPGDEVSLVLQDADGNIVGPTPNTAMFVIEAVVNGTVTSGDATFLFDGVVDRIGTSSITDGTAVNLFAEDLADDTTIYLASANATDWYRLGSGESSPSAPELPTGGTADQVLAKVNSTDYNVYWKDDANDGGSGLTSVTVTVTGTLAGDVTPSDATFTLTSPTVVNGSFTPPASITVTNTPPIWAETGDEVFARYNADLGGSATTNWDTGDAGNEPWLWRGYEDFDDTTNNSQVRGHHSGLSAFFGMASMAMGLAQGAVTSANSTFTGDNFTSLCGVVPGTTETVQNDFGFTIDDNGSILVVRASDADTWYCIQAECPA